MAPTELECPYKTSEAGCPYKTQKLELVDAKEMMEMHISLSHQAAPVREGRPQAERVKRPVLTFTGQAISQEEFEHFQYLFTQYKARLGTGHDTAALLRECLAEDVSKVLFSSHGSDLTKFDEEQLTKTIITCCVTKQTDQARTTELHRIIQDPGQPVQGFLANLKSKGRQCNMKLVCSSQTCQQVNDFSEPVIKSLFIAGLYDTELQQDLLAEQELTLEKAVQIAVARETAKSSQVILDGNLQAVAGISTYKKNLRKSKVPPDCCNSCGQKKHSDTSDCPARDNKCSCGGTGHFRNICMYDGKPKRHFGGKQETNLAEDTEKDEVGHSITESCFSIMLDETTMVTARPGDTIRPEGRSPKARGRPKCLPDAWVQSSHHPPAPPSLATPLKQPPVLLNPPRNTKGKSRKRKSRRNTQNNSRQETLPDIKNQCIPATDSHHQGKVVYDEYIGGMFTESLPSSQLFNEEHSLEQSTGPRPTRPPSEIFKCALQELGFVYHKMQQADEYNLCSADIIKAVMSELNSVSWLLHRAMQRSSATSDLSPHVQWPEEEQLYVMQDDQDYRFLQSPRGGGHNRASQISANQF